MQEDISQKSLIELKAMAYDQIATKEMAERNLATINGVIAQRFSAAAIVEQPDAPIEPEIPAEEAPAAPEEPVNPEVPAEDNPPVEEQPMEQPAPEQPTE